MRPLKDQTRRTATMPRANREFGNTLGKGPPNRPKKRCSCGPHGEVHCRASTRAGQQLAGSCPKGCRCNSLEVSTMGSPICCWQLGARIAHRNQEESPPPLLPLCCAVSFMPSPHKAEHCASW